MAEYRLTDSTSKILIDAFHLNDNKIVFNILDDTYGIVSNL